MLNAQVFLLRPKLDSGITLDEVELEMAKLTLCINASLAIVERTFQRGVDALVRWPRQRSPF